MADDFYSRQVDKQKALEARIDIFAYLPDRDLLELRCNACYKGYMKCINENRNKNLYELKCEKCGAIEIMSQKYPNILFYKEGRGA